MIQCMNSPGSIMGNQWPLKHPEVQVVFNAVSNVEMTTIYVPRVKSHEITAGIFWVLPSGNQVWQWRISMNCTFHGLFFLLQDLVGGLEHDFYVSIYWGVCNPN